MTEQIKMIPGGSREDQPKEEYKLAELVSEILIDDYSNQTIHFNADRSDGKVGMSMPEIRYFVDQNLTKEKILEQKDKLIDKIIGDGILDTSFGKTFTRDELEKLLKSALERNDSIKLRFMNGTNTKRNQINRVE